MTKCRMLAAILLISTGLMMGSAYAQETTFLSPVRQYEVDGNFAGEDGDTAGDLSGITCAPFPPSMSVLCLVIDDQVAFAQLATIQDGSLIPGAIVNLFGQNPPPAFGIPPRQHNCTGGQKRFKDLDGEGVAYSDFTFYVVGSHGCSGGDDEFRLSSFILSRVRLDREDDAFEIDHTYRVSDVLAAAEPIGSFFAKPLEAGGINIEGIAVNGADILFGLRTPSLEDHAFVVIAPVSELFSETDEIIPSRVLRLRLGPATGIRDMASLSGGRILILSGPSEDTSTGPYKLSLVDAKSGILRPIGRLATRPERDSGKPEGLAVLRTDGNQVDIVVLHDGPPNGDPVEYSFTLPSLDH